MRTRLISLVAAASLAAGLAACGEDGVKTFDGPTGTLKVKPGKEFRLRLEENPSTGYAWRFTRRPDPAVARLVGSDFKPEEGAENRAGAGGTRTFRFQAGEGGRTTIAMEYVFTGGERGRRPAAAKRLVVSVD